MLGPSNTQSLPFMKKNIKAILTLDVGIYIPCFPSYLSLATLLDSFV